MHPPLEKHNVAILCTNGFEQSEMTSPRQALLDAGAEVTLISPGDEDTIRGFQTTDWGDDFQRDLALEKADPQNYDALLLPGGIMNPDLLKANSDAIQFVRSFFDTNKPVAAICHAPQLLIEAEVVSGRRLTSYPTVRKDLSNAGADVVDEPAVVDGNLLTSRNPDDLPEFNAAMIKLIAETDPTAVPVLAGAEDGPSRAR